MVITMDHLVGKRMSAKMGHLGIDMLEFKEAVSWLVGWLATWVAGWPGVVGLLLSQANSLAGGLGLLGAVHGFRGEMLVCELMGCSVRVGISISLLEEL